MPSKYIRYVYNIVKRRSLADDRYSMRCELDSHADTCVAGPNCLHIADVGMTVQVLGYDGKHATDNVPIATVATLWQDPISGIPYILIIHEALYFGDRICDTLLNPNQLRANGLIVEDTPVQYDATSRHCVYVPDAQVTIPLSMRGVFSGFDATKPTWEEYEKHPHIVLTSELPWLPSSRAFEDEEEKAKSASEINATLTSRTGLEVMDDFGYRHMASVKALAAVEAGHDYDSFDERVLSLAKTSDRIGSISPDDLAKRWNIGLTSARATLQATSQCGIRNVSAPGERKLRQRLNHMKFPNLRGRFYTDTMFSKSKSLRGAKAAQVFTNGRGFDKVYPIQSKGVAHEALCAFIHDVGIPQTIVSDNAPEATKGEWRRTCQKYHVQQKVTVPHSPWSNLAEASIREIKRSVRKVMRKTSAPRRTWCYCSQWVTEVRKLTALNIPQLQGRTPYEDVLGSTPDITPFALFDWYQVVYYYEPIPDFPYERKSLGRWLGVADTTIDLMAYFILTKAGQVIVRKSVWAVNEDEIPQDTFTARLADLDASISVKIGDGVSNEDVGPGLIGTFPEMPQDLFEGDDEANSDPVEPEALTPEADDYTPESMDEYIAAQVLLPQGGELKMATVKARVKDNNGVPVGKRNPNPILDTRAYDVEFPDGSVEAISANLIAENIFSQVDEEGHTYSVLKDIVGHRSNAHAVHKDDGYLVMPTGTKRHRITTKGWDIQVEWRDGTTAWIPLKELKASNPVELAQYAASNKLLEEPAFAWWAKDVLRRKDRIIQKVKSKYWSRTHKFGVELPKSVAEALRIDDRTGTDLWKTAIEKEMKNVMPAFEFIEDDVVPKFYKHIDCHMIFDVKMDLTRKARFVAGGHQTDTPKESTYSSVVTRDSVRIAFTIAALNDLQVLSADVQNAYLNAPTKEKVYTTAGIEFGPGLKGRPVLIVKALYGLKSSGARWRDHMASTLTEAGYSSCLADPDVWMKPKVKPCGFKYWEYVLVYVDDILVISHEPQIVMDYLSQKYTLKSGSVGEPTAYLGAEVKKWMIEGAEDPLKPRWALSSDLYVKRAVANVERELTDVGERLSTKVKTPLTPGYRPEMDTSPELDSNRANYYQGLIGVLRWMCELGRVDILTPVTLLSHFLASPRAGHLEQVFHIFAYLKRYNRSTMVFDDTIPTFDESRFKATDWSAYYPNASEVIPPNCPDARGNSVTTTCFVDADHAACRVTRRSHTGVIIYVNRAPIIWFSKRQNTVESSTFGSEFIAMRISIELVEALRYKLWMMGVPIDGSTNVFCDNEAVVKNSTVPESTLKKKHNAISYHRTREAQASGTIRIAKEPGTTNLADLFTKLLPGPRLRELSKRILW